MKKKSFKIFLIFSFILLSLISCGISDMYSGGTLVIKAPNFGKNSRDNNVIDIISLYKVNLTASIKDPETGKIELSESEYNYNLVPGGSLVIRGLKPGLYYFQMDAYQVADKREYFQTSGNLVNNFDSPDGQPFVEIKSGEKTSVNVTFYTDSINPVTKHQIEENENGSSKNPVSSIDDLRLVLSNNKTYQLPTEVFISDLSPEDSTDSIEISSRIILNTNLSFVDLENVRFQVKENGCLEINNPVISFLRNDTISEALFSIKEKGKLILKNVHIKSESGNNVATAIKTESKSQLEIFDVTIENFVYGGVSIDKTPLIDYLKSDGYYYFNNVTFINCHGDITGSDIFTGSDLHLAGNNNVIGEIALYNTNESSYDGSKNFSRIFVSDDFKSAADTNVTGNANPTKLKINNLSNTFSIYNKGIEYNDKSGSVSIYPELVLMESGSNKKIEEININKSLDVLGYGLSYKGIVLRSCSPLLNGFEGFPNTASYSYNNCSADFESEEGIYDLNPQYEIQPIKIDNYDYIYDNIPICFYNHYKYQTNMGLSRVPFLNITRNGTLKEPYEYNVIFDGTDKYQNSTSPDENGIIFKLQNGMLNGINSGDASIGENAVIRIGKNSKVLFKDITIEHGIKNSWDYFVNGFSTSGNLLVLENVNFNSINIDDGLEGDGASVEVFYEENASQRIVKLKGTTNAKKIVLKAGSQIVIDFTDLIIPDYVSNGSSKLFKLEIEPRKEDGLIGEMIVVAADSSYLNYIDYDSDNYIIESNGMIRKK